MKHHDTFLENEHYVDLAKDSREEIPYTRSILKTLNDENVSEN